MDASSCPDRDTRDNELWWQIHSSGEGEALELYGGTQVIDFVPVSVVVEAILRSSDVALGPMPVNVGSGTGTSLRDLAQRVATLPGAHSAVVVKEARQVEVTRYVADVTRMRTLLHLDPPSDPLEGLAELWADSRSNTLA